MKKNLIKSLILLLSIIIIFLHFKRKESYIAQVKMMSDLNVDNYEREYDFIESIDDYYPSLTLYTIPVKAIKGKYYIENDSIERGLEYINASLEENPFLMYGEAMLADIYDRIGLKDQFYKYTRQSIKALPNNPVHFILYSKMMNQLGNTDSIVNHFNKIKLTRGGSRDFQVYNITMASIVNDTLNYEKYNAIDIANEAREKFPNNASINMLADYIIYSKENIERAEEFQKKGRKIFEQEKYEESLKLFNKAFDLHPTKQLYQDDIILAHFALNEYEKVVALYDGYLTKYTYIEDPTLYYFGLSFYNTEQFNRACTIFSLLKDRDFAVNPQLVISCNI